MPGESRSQAKLHPKTLDVSPDLSSPCRGRVLGRCECRKPVIVDPGYDSCPSVVSGRRRLPRTEGGAGGGDGVGLRQPGAGPGSARRDVQSVTEPGAARPAPVPITVRPAGRRGVVRSSGRRLAGWLTRAHRLPAGPPPRACGVVSRSSARARGVGCLPASATGAGHSLASPGPAVLAARQKSLLQVVPVSGNQGRCRRRRQPVSVTAATPSPKTRCATKPRRCVDSG